jgi:hypothetical protein
MSFACRRIASTDEAAEKRARDDLKRDARFGSRAGFVRHTAARFESETLFVFSQFERKVRGFRKFGGDQNA